MNESRGESLHLRGMQVAWYSGEVDLKDLSDRQIKKCLGISFSYYPEFEFYSALNAVIEKRSNQKDLPTST